MGDVVARVEIGRDEIGQESEVGDVGRERVGVADSHRLLGLLALRRRAHLEDDLVIAVREDAALVRARPADGAIELEYVLTGGWPGGVRGDEPLWGASGPNAGGDVTPRGAAGRRLGGGWR